MSVTSKLTAAKSILTKEGPFRLFSKTFKQFVLPFLYLPTIHLAVKKAKKSGHSVRELIDFTFDACGGYLAPMQIKSELASFMESVRDQKPQVVMEIGTARGGSLFLLAQMAPKNALIISLDIPGGKLGGYPSWKIPLYKSFASGRQRIAIVKADSHDERTVGKIEKILGGRKIDLLFIDADHTYQGVKRDFDLYSPLVRPGGRVAFHDVATKIPATFKSEVDIFWTELKQEYEYKEFVEDWQQGWAGIGYVVMK
jgi:predicted O-methyltransferase YrrM